MQSVLHGALLFALPFLSELKISWAFAAAPLHFQQQSFPLWAFGATIGGATLCRVPMNALLTTAGDFLIVPVLVLAVIGAACMLAAPNDLWSVALGIAAGHATDTAQVQASLCYRWREGDAAAQKRGLRLQAFSATFGYSSGALLGGALYEHAGFDGCASLQLGILVAMAVLAAGMPVVHASFAQSWRARATSTVQPTSPPSAAQEAKVAAPGATAVVAGGEAETDAAAEVEAALSVRTTTGRLLLPVSLVWLCDGANIACYIAEW